MTSLPELAWRCPFTVKAAVLIVLFACASAISAQEAVQHQHQVKTIGEESYSVRLLFEDDFNDLSRWIVEGDGQARVRDNQLIGDCFREKQTAGTIWCRTPFTGATVVEYDAVAVDGQSNLNFIAYATHPGGLRETSNERTGAYKEYHLFPNYIVTYLSSDQVPQATESNAASNWRVRFRRNPGFNLLSETFAARQPTASSKQQLTYVFEPAGEIALYVDGKRWDA